MTDLTKVEHTGVSATTDLIDHTAQGPMLPRAGLLRDITDRTVLEQVYAMGRVTRSALAVDTGISKPTISDSVRRLEAVGILSETGQTSGGRGRNATYYELAKTAGWAMAIELDQDTIQSCCATVAGTVFDESYRMAPSDPDQLMASLRSVVLRHRRGARDEGPLRVVSMSVANPVDPEQAGIVPLPATAFPQFPLDLPSAFKDLGDTGILIENDVNLSAWAERQTGTAQHLSSFGYFYVGAGLGFAFYVGDLLIRGSRGLAGEMNYLPTSPTNKINLMNYLIEHGFARHDRGLDVVAVRALLDRAQAGDPDAAERIRFLCDALASAIASVYGILDPEQLIIGGPLGRHPYMIDGLRAAVHDRLPWPAPITAGSVEGSAALRGATLRAVEAARNQLMELVLSR